MNLEGYKTYIVAALMAALPTITTAVNHIDWVTVLTGLGVQKEWIVPLASFAAAVVMAIMRKITQATTVKTALETEPPKKQG